MAGTSTVVAAGVAVIAHKVKRSLTSWRKLVEEDDDHKPRRALMSMLVHCTYFRDLYMVETWGAWVTDYKNKPAMKYGKEHWEAYQCRNESELKDLGLAFLCRKPKHKNPEAPDLAIVLRGTIPTRKGDLLADWNIGVHQFNQSHRVLRSVELILQVVEEFLRDSRNKMERICMTGHSLGAAIALIVGGYLYSTHGINIDTHLFNPPLLTLVDVVRGLPPDDYKVQVDFSKLKVALVGNRTAMHNEWEQFQKLEEWVPHIYLNPCDPICRQYISFYRSKQQRPVENPGDVISSQALLSGLFSSTVTYFKNVVPSANLYISTWETKKHRLARFAGPLEEPVKGRLPHSLRQWHKYKPEYIELSGLHKARLLRPQRDAEIKCNVDPPIPDYSHLAR